MARHLSPLGRPVEVVEGNAGDIEDRGQQIINLGGVMREGYNALTRVVVHGLESSMEGEAVDKLAEVSREVYTELDLAATLYEQVGPYVRDYGTSLDAVQAKMRLIVPAADELWRIYQQRVSDYDDARITPVVYPSGTSPSDDGSEREAAEREHAQAVSSARTARDNAYDAWHDEAEDFDAQYDTWQVAFDRAVSGIRTEIANGIQDDWRDDLDGFVAGALFVLQIAAIVLAIAALVIGGPFIAVLSTLVAIATLIGTAWQFHRGDAGWLDLGLAIVGVIPFGALAEMFSTFRAGGNVWAAGVRTWLDISPVSGNSALMRDIITGFSDDAARWGSAFTSSRGFLNLFSGVRGADLLSSFVTGQTDEMWKVIAQIGDGPETAGYMLAALGNWVQSADSLADLAEVLEVAVGG